MKTIKQLILVVVGFGGLLAILIVLSVGLLGEGMDKSIDSQNEMLCNSAKISGNKDYLNICQEYYSTGSVEYMRGE